MVVIVFVIAYLLGSIPFGVLYAKMKGVNLLESGSRNTGATNAFRTAGLAIGIATAVSDILKGFVAVWFAGMVLDTPWQIYTAGVLAILGHTMSIFMKFRGGKAIATSFGVFLYVNPIPILLTLIVWIVVMFLTRIVSLASILSAVAFPIVSLFFWKDWFVYVISFGIAAYAIYRHKDNIIRLINGQEKKITSSRRNLK